MYVQVQHRDRNMHNKCDHISIILICRLIYLNKIEYEHMH